MFKFVVLVALVAVASAQNFNDFNGGFNGAFNGGFNGALNGGFNGAVNPAFNPSRIAPSLRDNAEVQAYDVDVRPDGFQYRYALSNGAAASVAGDQAGNHQGSYQWTSPEGTPVRVDFVADENGYRASGDVLPTPPPIPDAILRSLEYIRTHPNEENRQGSGRQLFNQGQQFLNQGQF